MWAFTRCCRTAGPYRAKLEAEEVEVRQPHVHAQPILMNMLIRRVRVHFTIHFFLIIASFS